MTKLVPGVAAPDIVLPGKLSIIIDEQGKVVKAHYCKDTVDHIPIDGSTFKMSDYLWEKE